jgi:hypothetical protein
MSAIPGLASLLEFYQNRRERNYFSRFKNSEEIFTYYYRNNSWGSDESASGDGSTIRYTENIRKELPVLFQKLDVHRILDAPCGDYHWFRLIPRNENLHYTGGDIVEPLVLKNQQQFGNAATGFIKLDITKDPLPKADLWICRDAFFHLSYEDIFKTINNLTGSGIRYFLTSTYTECRRNMDFPTGTFRQINLQRPPFCFCKPLLLIDDWIKGFAVKKMGLWEKEMLLEALSAK